MPHHKSSLKIPILSRINPISRVDTYFDKFHNHIAQLNEASIHNKMYFMIRMYYFSQISMLFRINILKVYVEDFYQ